MRWQKHHDLKEWKAADSIYRGRRTWAEWEGASGWHDTKGEHAPRVLVQIERRRTKDGSFHLKVELPVFTMPALEVGDVEMSDVAKVSRLQCEREAELRRMQDEEAQREEERRAKAANELIAKVPFALRFALLASGATAESSKDIVQIARDGSGPRCGRMLLKSLVDSNRPDDVTRIARDYSHILGRRLVQTLRVPVPERNTALVYVAVVNQVGESWEVTRFEGPHKQTGNKLLRELGSENMLRVKIEEPVAGEDDTGFHRISDASLNSLHKFLLEPIELCGRQFAYFDHKLDGKDDQLWYIAVGSSVAQRLVDAPRHWSSAGASEHKWASAAEARALLADFATLAVPKMAKRLGLAHSPTMRWLKQFSLQAVVPERRSDGSQVVPDADPNETVINVVEWDDIKGVPDDAGNASVMTDGAGRISIDLMQGVPRLDSGRLLSVTEEVGGDEVGGDEVRGSAPLVVQARLWYAGSIAKGLWFVDSTLPPRTMLVYEKQRKCAGRAECKAATAGTSSFEIIRTYESWRQLKFDVYLVPLLEAAAGDRKEELHNLVLRIQSEAAMKVLELSSKQLQKVVRRQRAKDALLWQQRYGVALLDGTLPPKHASAEAAAHSCVLRRTRFTLALKHTRPRFSTRRSCERGVRPAERAVSPAPAEGHQRRHTEVAQGCQVRHPRSFAPQ